MRNLSFFFWASLLVDGVFGVNVTVSVMKGDSVTLNPLTVIPVDDSAEWWFGGKFIAKMNKAANTFSTSEGDDVRFKGRLKLDHQTGSLTITNITTDHAGLYKLQIRGKTETSKIFSVTVSDVVESVSVTDGDSVTLHTGVTGIQRDDQIWKSGDQVLNGSDDKKWRNIHRNNENGEITIRNIRTNQSGDYELEINTKSMILHKKLCINILDEMKTVSVKEGEFVTLRTGVIDLKIYDLILWKFKDQLIAKTIKLTNQMSLYDTSDEIFKGRLQLNEKTGSLSISGSRTTDSGDYHLNMTSTSHTVQRTISVTVSDSGVSSGALAGIVVVLLLLQFLV